MSNAKEKSKIYEYEKNSFLKQWYVFNFEKHVFVQLSHTFCTFKIKKKQQNVGSIVDSRTALLST